MSTLTWPDLLGALIAGDDLTAAQTGWAMDQVMTGEATSAQIAGFAVALRAKGETPDEVLGMADSMLRHARPVDVAGRAIDIVGTGGDQAHTVNISTMTAIVTAAAGVPVVKHGARASSSKCGTGDVLEELGVAIELPPDAVHLASGGSYRYQAFRIGPVAWGLQYHPEVTQEDFATWVRFGHGSLVGAGLDPRELLQAVIAAETSLRALAEEHATAFAATLRTGVGRLR